MFHWTKQVTKETQINDGCMAVQHEKSELLKWISISLGVFWYILCLTVLQDKNVSKLTDFKPFSWNNAGSQRVKHVHFSRIWQNVIAPACVYSLVAYTICQTAEVLHTARTPFNNIIFQEIKLFKSRINPHQERRETLETFKYKNYRQF